MMSLGKPSEKKVRTNSSIFVAQNFSEGGEGVPPKLRTFVADSLTEIGGIGYNLRIFVTF